MTSIREQFPPPPEFSAELIARCRETRDSMPVLFELYKHTAIIAGLCSRIGPDSPAFRPIPPVHHAVLIGHLNRMSRLILSTVRLGHQGKYGETTRLLARCINETAIRARWLCERAAMDRFERYLADGLRSDLELKVQIRKNIEGRAGATLEIEARMLRTVDRLIHSSGLSEDEVLKAKRLPTFKSMCDDIGLPDFDYLTIQRLGSHEVHGTWPDLLLHYVRKREDGSFEIRDLEARPSEVHFAKSALLVLDALDSFVRFITDDTEVIGELSTYFSEIRARILEADSLGLGSDFSIVGE